jgi:uncharacterized protein (DUF58 family)
MGAPIEVIDYRLGWRAAGVRPGSHRSRVAGVGEDFQGLVLFGEGRDARRLDVRASATDALGRAWVRQFRQRSRVPVVMLADLSRSMHFEGCSDRTGELARFARALGRGAARAGDPFGFIGFDRHVPAQPWLVPTRSREAGEHVATWIEHHARTAASDPQAEGAEGLLAAARWLPRQRSLLFLLSDLYLDPALMERALASFAAHDCIVLLMADSAERQPPARWGLARLADLESGQERMVLLRPGLESRLAAQQQARRAQARAIARRHGASLLVAEDGVDLVALTRHFLRRGGA